MSYLDTPPLTPPPHAVTSDILFLSATVVPGDDTPSYVADVLVADGLIARIVTPGTTVSDHEGQEHDTKIIDAKGYWLTPGFIDMHAHSDLYLLTHPEHEAKISQGCTVSHH
jgi:N-acyl-D-aspartate/D-glutamate deacylase